MRVHVNELMRDTKRERKRERERERVYTHKMDQRPKRLKYMQVVT